MSNKRTLGFMRDKNYSDAEVFSGGEGIKMMVRITGGQNAIIAPPLVIFKNADRIYPLRNCPENVLRMRYRVSPKEFVDHAVFTEHFAERKVQYCPERMICELNDNPSSPCARGQVYLHLSQRQRPSSVHIPLKQVAAASTSDSAPNRKRISW